MGGEYKIQGDGRSNIHHADGIGCSVMGATDTRTGRPCMIFGIYMPHNGEDVVMPFDSYKEVEEFTEKLLEGADEFFNHPEKMLARIIQDPASLEQAMALIEMMNRKG